jgi:hypothetical protein
MTAHDRIVAHRIGKLCIGADAALADGDFQSLRSFAKRLASYAHEPLHCQLVDLAEACTADIIRAGALWPRLRDRVYRSVDP